MTYRGQSSGAILWDLLLRGDVIENYKGGDAAQTLFNRITENGYQFGTFRYFRDTLRRVEKKAMVRVQQKSGKVFVIQLLDKNFQKRGRGYRYNPYAETPEAPVRAEVVAKPVPVENELDFDLEKIRSMRISDRLKLANFINTSIDEDLSTFKTGVNEGL